MTTVWGGESDGRARLDSVVAGAGWILAGDASRMDVRVPLPEEAGVLLPLRGFFARSFVGCTQNDVASALDSAHAKHGEVGGQVGRCGVRQQKRRM